MEPNNISDFFFSFDNPLIYAIFFANIIVILAFLIKREFINPLTTKKIKLELENAKLTAMYSEVDPDPVIRIDNSWNVIDMNQSAKLIFDDKIKLLELLNNVRKNKKRDEYLSNVPFEKKHYSVNIKDLSELNYKHIYLHDITTIVENEERIKNYQNSLKELRMKIENINEEEKQRIGQELHDSVGHSISLLKLEIEDMILSKKVNLSQEKSQNVLKNIDDLANEVRELSQQLRPRILNEFGLLKALKSLVDKTNQNSEIKGFVTHNKNFYLADKKLEQNLYRICQEALNNIIKHSSCSEYSIDLKLINDTLEIIISDDGKGFDLDEQFSNERTSLGLLNMKERIESFGGNFTIDSMLNMGTSIIINIKAIEEKDD